MLVLTEVSCPNCLAPIDLHDQIGNTLSCGACRTSFVLEGHLCPRCNSYHKEEIDNCGRCGTSLKRICGKCHTSNWAGDEYCKSCKVAMDLIDLTVVNFHKESAQHREVRLEQVRDMRLREEARSKERRIEMEKIEQQRQIEARERLETQKKQDIKIWIFVIIIGFCGLGVGLSIILALSI